MCREDPLTKQCDANGEVIFYGSVIDRADIEEDLRYVGHIAMLNLSGDSVYRATVEFILSSGGSVTSHATRVQTIGCQGGADVTFIGGGDYRVGGLGQKFLVRGLAYNPNASFVFIGGDIAYENNLRTCYLRLDQVLWEMISVITSPRTGALLPLLTAVGNHEGGGYMLASSKKEREEGFVFYWQYFPHLSQVLPYLSTTSVSQRPASIYEVDYTLVFHSHAITPNLGFIVLDSETFTTCQDQVEWLRAALNALVHNQPQRRVLVMYHNPAYPGSRDFDADVSPQVRQYFIPVLDEFESYVPIVFEHHDHLYKRTYPLWHGKLVDATAAAGVRGIVYVGDGALGVHEDNRDLNNQYYLAKGEEGNYVMSVRRFASNTTVRVDVVRLDGTSLDTVSR